MACALWHRKAHDLSEVRKHEHTPVRRGQGTESRRWRLAYWQRTVRPGQGTRRPRKRTEGKIMSVNLDDVDFGSSKCVCPKCGNEIPHARRGIPCSQVKCPKCGTLMIGRKCRKEES